MPHIDAELLLSHVLRKSRTWIFAHPEERVSAVKVRSFAAYATRRMQGEPIAHIIGSKEFYGRSFRVTGDTLVPRPATEGLIDVAIDFLRNRKNVTETIDSHIVAVARCLRNDTIDTIVDVGTGSGCIITTLAHTGMPMRLIGVDTSAAALSVAKQNAEAHGMIGNITFIEGDGIVIAREMREPFLVVSNPPYIPEGFQLDETIYRYEPKQALIAGKNGMDVIGPLVTAMVQNSACEGFVIECREEQADAIDAIMRVNH